MNGAELWAGQYGFLEETGLELLLEQWVGFR